MSINEERPSKIRTDSKNKTILKVMCHHRDMQKNMPLVPGAGGRLLAVIVYGCLMSALYFSLKVVSTFRNSSVKQPRTR